MSIKLTKFEPNRLINVRIRALDMVGYFSVFSKSRYKYATLTAFTPSVEMCARNRSQDVTLH